MAAEGSHKTAVFRNDLELRGHDGLGARSRCERRVEIDPQRRTRSVRVGFGMDTES